MAAYVDRRNPSCWFFEALGGQWLREPNGQFTFSWGMCGPIYVP